MGTWCPNCRDETEFLVNYLDENPNRELAVIGIAFERYQNRKDAFDAIEKYRDQLDVPYPILYGGNASKSAASEALPMINNVISYPTTIFLDKDNKVVKIHTGFSGPATSEWEEYVSDFQEVVDSLVN